MTGEEGGEGEGEGGENCHMLITSLLNEGAVIKILNENESKQNLNEKKNKNHEIQSNDPLYHVIFYNIG